MVGECETCKEERDVLEKMRKLEECDTEKFDTLHSRDKTIAILEDGWWPQAAKQEGENISEKFRSNIWTERNERPAVGGVYNSSRISGPSRMGCMVNAQMSNANNK